jgi:hypothetical protein
MIMQTYTGGCHCGAVRYEVSADLPYRGKESADAVIECNCSHCHAKGLMLAFVPATQFTLHKGEDELSEYRFHNKKISHLFCRHCGVQSFARGNKPDGTPVVSINVRCLDNVDTSTLTINPFNGKEY